MQPNENGYSDESLFSAPVGENVLTVAKDGSLSHEWKAPDEKPNKWKGAKRIAALPDQAVSIIGTRSNGIVDYRIENASVSWRGLGHGKKREYLCHTHVCNSCPCIKRIKRFREEHSPEKL